MNKKDLIAKIAERKENRTKKDSEEMLNDILDIIEETLADGENIHIIGFGNFDMVEKAEVMRKNPRNGEPISVPAKKVPVFKFGKVLKDRITKIL